MGIVNVTPDSFADGGRWPSADAAIEHGRLLLAQGADILDVGGESTRPGAAPVPAEVELRRVLPVIEALAEHCVVSVDTRKPDVARQCLRTGACIVNDVSGLLWPVAAEFGADWIVMHMRGAPQTMQVNPTYVDVTREVLDHLVERADTARNAGVQQIWIDPGIGFGKTLEHNLTLLRTLPEFVSQQYPVLIGASRKSFIHHLVGAAEDPADRLPGSLAVAVHAALSGVSVLRVHDVAETVQAIRVAEAISRVAVAAPANARDEKWS